MKPPPERQLNLTTAVNQIFQACHLDEDDKPPFFFIVGAGLSVPSIPLAAEIEEECKQTAMEYGHNDSTTNLGPLERYSFWFESAFQQRIHRQKYLRKKMEMRPISHATLRLAHLLSEKKVANIVVTPNFDDLITKALNLFGIQHIICDHSQTVERIDTESEDIQIIHVHGTYWFYDCCNLKGEITTQAQPSEQTTRTMSALLDNILTRRAPLVMGYSGWEGDVIMSALKRRLNSPMGYRLYWFCYRLADLEQLPDWLKTNRDVFFVSLEQPPARPNPARPRLPIRKSDGNLELTLASEGKLFDEEPPEEKTLPAQMVLDEINKQFNLGIPKLLDDPLGFLAKHLELSLPQDQEAPKEPTPYFFSSVIHEIEQARKCIIAKKNESNLETQLESKIEEIRNAVRQSQYSHAIQKAKELIIFDLSNKQLEDLWEAVLSATKAHSERLEERLTTYEFLIQCGSALLQQSPENKIPIQTQVASALINKGLTLRDLNRREEGIPAYDEVVARFGQATEPVLLERVARALVNKGIALGILDRRDEELAVYDEVEARFSQATESVLREAVARALSHKGFSLGALDRMEEELAVNDEVVARFGQTTEPMLREAVARALVNKGLTLGALDRREEELAVYDEIVARFGLATEPALLERVAMALVNKGFALGALDRMEEELAVYDEVVARFGQATEPALLEAVARALVNKGLTLGALNSEEEELAVYDEIVARFGQATEPALQVRVAIALTNKGLTLRDLNRREEEIAAYDEVEARFGQATEPVLREEVAKTLFNKGLTLGALDRREEELAVYDEIVARFGQATEPALLKAVASALVNKGLSLKILKKFDPALATFNQVIDCFKNMTEPGVRKQVARAIKELKLTELAGKRKTSNKKKTKLAKKAKTEKTNRKK